jgi:hypothetical protein
MFTFELIRQPFCSGAKSTAAATMRKKQQLQLHFQELPNSFKRN